LKYIDDKLISFLKFYEINYIISVKEYKLMYKTSVQQFINLVYFPSNMISTSSTYYDLLKEYTYVCYTIAYDDKH